MEAAVLLQRCPVTKRTFGVRVQKMEDGDWWRTWMFPLRDEIAISEGYDKTQIVGNFYPTENCPSCPDCGARGFLVCSCGKNTCWKGESEKDCEWCGAHYVNLVPATEKLKIPGRDF